MKKICVLDYGVGNLRSVSNAIAAIGAEAHVTADRAAIADADGMIIPGVGAFPHCKASLQNAGFVEDIGAFIASGRMVLGICVGMQMLFERSTEFTPTDGLGIVSGTVDRIPISRDEGRLPHIAWSHVEPSEAAAGSMFADLDQPARRFYFVHSYAATNVPSANVAGTTIYHGHSIVAAVHKENIWGTQFHPEKSGPSGLQVLANFAARC